MSDDKTDWRYWVAADEIDALRAENERLRTVVKNLLIDIGESGRRGRALDLLPRKSVDEGWAALGEQGKG